MITSLILFAVSIVFYTLSQKRVFSESDEWKKKYLQPLTTPPKTWYYKITGLKYKERFPLSGTLLVSLTDKYHLMQLFFKLFLCAAIAFYKPWFGYWDAGIYFVLFGVVFTLTYRFGKSSK